MCIYQEKQESGVKNLERKPVLNPPVYRNHAQFFSKIRYM